MAVSNAGAGMNSELGEILAIGHSAGWHRVIPDEAMRQIYDAVSLVENYDPDDNLPEEVIGFEIGRSSFEAEVYVDYVKSDNEVVLDLYIQATNIGDCAPESVSLKFSKSLIRGERWCEMLDPETGSKIQLMEYDSSQLLDRALNKLGEWWVPVISHPYFEQSLACVK